MDQQTEEVCVLVFVDDILESGMRLWVRCSVMSFVFLANIGFSSPIWWPKILIWRVFPRSRFNGKRGGWCGQRTDQTLLLATREYPCTHTTTHTYTSDDDVSTLDHDFSSNSPVHPFASVSLSSPPPFSHRQGQKHRHSTMTNGEMVFQSMHPVQRDNTSRFEFLFFLLCVWVRKTRKNIVFLFLIPFFLCAAQWLFLVACRHEWLFLPCSSSLHPMRMTTDIVAHGWLNLATFFFFKQTKPLQSLHPLHGHFVSLSVQKWY